MSARTLIKFDLRLLPLAVCLALPLIGYSSKQAIAKATTGQIVARLNHQEAIFHSADCIFQSVRLATPTQNIPLIRQVCRSQAREGDYKRYVLTESAPDDTPEIIEGASHTVRWLRDGLKERYDFFPLGDLPTPPAESAPLRTLAFDGSIVRTLGRSHDNQLLGSIQTMRDAHWDTDNKPDPSSAIFDYCNTPYSQIISKGRDLTISPTRRNGADLTQVTVKHPHWNEASTLLFDEQMRLLERCVIKQLSTDPKPRTTEKHTFSEYQEQQLASGEKIWIPHKIEWRYYMGNLPDGTPVDFTADVLTIRRIDLNVHIPDDKFVIRFPAGTKIWDGLAGLGYIDEPAQRTIDQSISDLIGDKTADAQHSSGARPHSADANTEGRVIPASDVPRPLAADSPPTPTTRRWPFYALLLTLAVLVLSVLVRLRTKKRPT